MTPKTRRTRTPTRAPLRALSARPGRAQAPRAALCVPRGGSARLSAAEFSALMAVADGQDPASTWQP